MLNAGTIYRSFKLWFASPSVPGSLLVIVTALALSTACAMGQVTIHVPGDHSTIQAAIDAAENGDEIVVAPGMHAGPIDMLGKAVYLRSIDGPDTTTIHSGGAVASIITIASGEGPDTIIEGFTITGGNGTLIPGGITVGGGITIYASSPTILNCNLIANTASFGGAIDVEDGSPLIDGCTFTDNHASLGGAVSLIGSTATISNSTFIDNTAIVGGAVYHGIEENSTISGSMLTNNHASGSGGAIHVDDGTPTIEQCDIISNTAVRGGGIYVTTSKPNILGSTLTENHAELSGGGIYHLAASSFIDACVFDGNTTSPELAGRNPLFSEAGGGAIYNTLLSHPTLSNSEFHANHSTINGGAILNVRGSGATIVGCTFTHNVSEFYGDALYNLMSDAVTIADSVFDSNCVVGTPCFVIYSLESISLDIVTSSFVNHQNGVLVQALAVNNLHVEASTFENNVVARVISSFSNSFARLLDNTIANNTATFEVVRVLSGEVGGTLFCGNEGDDIVGTWTDLGGNEFLENCPWTLPGDLNGDGVVDVDDLFILLAAWGECVDTDDCPADLDGNGVVDIDDLFILLSNWG